MMKVLHVFTLATTAEGFFDGQFKYLSENGHDITLVCSYSVSIDDFAKRNTVKYVPIRIARTLSPIADLKTLNQLVRLIRRENFDAVVGHTPKGALLAMTAARIAGCKNRIYLRHGFIYTTAMGLKRSILKAEEKFVSSLATNIINVSPSIGKLAVKDKLNKDSKQTVIGKGTCGGIDTIDTFNPSLVDIDMVSTLRFSQEITKDDYVIGFCGRLCKDKGIPELIEGFRLFREQNPSIKTKLLLVGGYDSRDILPESIHQTIDADKDILYTGKILKNIRNYYALMDVFVFPSHREGFGMCSIEAQAMQVPALVTQAHGCVDTIQEGITGYYIDFTPESICEKLLLLHNPTLRAEMGKSARQFVCDNFERTKLWPLIKDYYNEILNRP